MLLVFNFVMECSSVGVRLLSWLLLLQWITGWQHGSDLGWSS